MKNKIFILCFGILLVSLISSMYAGESETFNFGFKIVNCSIINNTYNLDGLNLSWNGKNVTISTVINYKPDNFSVSCWVIKYKDVVQHIPSSGGGGSGCKYKKNFNWNCSEWGECVNETQTRICKEYNNCGNTFGKPNTIQNCIGKEPEKPDEPFRPLEIAKKSWKYILNIILVILILFILCQMSKSIKNRKSKPKKRKK